MKHIVVNIALVILLLGLAPAALLAQDGLTLERLRSELWALAERVSAIETKIAPKTLISEDELTLEILEARIVNLSVQLNTLGTTMSELTNRIDVGAYNISVLNERLEAVESRITYDEGPPAPAEHWTDATTGLHDLASVLAKTDEAEDVAPYITLVEEFADCIGSELDEETEETYDDLSHAEMVAMTIWAAGIFGTYSAFENDGGDTSYSYIEGAIEACRQSEEE